MSVHGIADRYVEDAAALDPMNATYLGLPGHDTEMTDFSPDGYVARAGAGAAALRAMSAARPTDDSEALARAIFLERVGLDQEIHAAGLDVALNTITSPVQEIRRVFDFMPTGTPEEWAAVAARLEQVPRTLAGLRVSLHRSGTATARQAHLVARQCDAWAGRSGSSSFFADLVAPAPDLDKLAEAAANAYAEFGRWLREDLAPRVPWGDAVGTAAYQLLSRFHLGTAVDLREAYEWGWAEFLRLEAEIREVAGRIRPGAPTAEVAAALDADPRHRVRGREGFRAWAQALADRALAELRGTAFDIPDELMRLDVRVAPDGGPSGQFYYAAPAADFSRDGAMWWGPPAVGEEFPTWKSVTTVYHEGAPGHHLQIGTAMLRAGALNRYQRLIAFVSGHAEGWAMYVESLMRELGYLTDDAHLLGGLDSQLRRAARVMLDIGVHLELPPPAGAGVDGDRWTPDLATAFLTDRTLGGPIRAAEDVTRLLGIPGHSTTYKLGERVWLDCVADVRSRHGHGLDLRHFHAYALNLGSLPLDILRTRLAAY